MSKERLSLLLPLLIGLATLFGAELSAPLHDLSARLAPAVDLPVVLLEVSDVEGAQALAAEAARDAGAREVWTFEPAAGVAARALPLPLANGELSANELGLPMVEAIDQLIWLSADQLGPGTSPRLLAGRDALLLPAGADQSDVAAIAVGAWRDNAQLRLLPRDHAALLVALLAALWWLRLQGTRRWRIPRQTTILMASAVAAALVARRYGWDLPVGGLLAAIVAPALISHAAPLLERLGAPVAHAPRRVSARIPSI